MAEHTYTYNVTMTCGGCSGAVERVLKKLDGLNSFKVDLPSQTAIIKTESVDFDTVTRAIAKTGKKINSADVDGEPRKLPDVTS